jgi:hypothetical protein
MIKFIVITKTVVMKSFLLLLATTLSITAFSQQNDTLHKRDNFFVAAELGKSLAAGSVDRQYGVSLVYNRRLGKTNFGLGAGAELIDLGSKSLGGVMPVLDVRYYAKSGRSHFIPIGQAGYNFYRFQYQKSGSPDAYTLRGGLGYTLGLGYSYSFTGTGSGVFGALKFKGLQYEYSHPSLQKRNTSERMSLSVGWRF